MRAAVHIGSTKEAKRLGINLRRADKTIIKAKKKTQRLKLEEEKLLLQKRKVTSQVRRMEIDAKLARARKNLNIAQAEEKEAIARKNRAQAKIWEERKHRVDSVLNFMFGQPKHRRRR